MRGHETSAVHLAQRSTALPGRCDRPVMTRPDGSCHITGRPPEGVGRALRTRLSASSLALRPTSVTRVCRPVLVSGVTPPSVQVTFALEHS